MIFTIKHVGNISDQPGPIMSLVAARLLTEQELKVFPDEKSLRRAIIDEGKLILERKWCPIGILQLAKFLQQSTKSKIMRVLMKAEPRSSLGEIPGVLDMCTPCSSDDFSHFIAGHF